MPAQTIIKLRRDTAANWTSVDPTLASGEIGVETDTNQIKLGDGTTAWSSLDYFGVLDSIDDIAGVAITSASTGEVLKFDGTNWVNADVSYNELTDVPSSFTPSTHASTHELNGSDQIEIDPSQVTGTAVVDSDSRLTDSRTPTAHASTHEDGGSDEITIAQSQVVNLTTDLSAKANISDVTNPFLLMGA